MKARDADGDGHGDALCGAAPGDDCDDTHKTVYPGAPELCDGLDNDCNGKFDLQDGFTLSGTPGTLDTTNGNPPTPVVAWSPTAKTYGVVWIDERTTDAEVYFARFDQTGARVGGIVTVTTGNSSKDQARIVWGGDAFGVVWVDNRDGNQEIYFQRIDAANGSLIGGPTRVSNDPGHSTDPQLTRNGTANWIVVWLDDRDSPGTPSLYGRALDYSGTDLGASSALVTRVNTAVTSPQIAGSGPSFALAWSENREEPVP